jgi:hypothetical protein
MGLGGGILRFGQTGLRALELLASIVVLAIFSYYLAVLANHKLPIAQWIRAVTGISGAAVLYGFFGVFLTLCLGGIGFFAFIAVVLDICFVGCFVAVAYLTRGGAGSCSGDVHTPLGSGPANSHAPGYGQNGFGFGRGATVTYFPNLRQACRLETACFSVSIVNIFLFLVTAAVQVLLARHHRKEKRYGPSPANNYTSGSGRTPFWKRARFGRQQTDHGTLAAEAATAGTAPMRTSYETGYTGNTLPGTADSEPKYGQPGYGQTHFTTHY